MNTVIKTITSYFSQNTQTQRKLEIESEINKLKTALNNRSGDAFKRVISEAGEQFQKDLNAEKTRCLQSLARLNGEFFQDPNSLLKKAWDAIVKLLQLVGINIKNRNELEEYETKLRKSSGNRAPLALAAIEKYKKLEAKRDSMATLLDTIVSTEKTISKDFQTQLESKKKDLEKHKKALCGSYYQDPNGELDMAWKAYTAELSAGNSSASSMLLEQFHRLDDRRKSYEAQLCEIEKHIRVAIDPERTVEALAIAIIPEETKHWNRKK
jgi:hypothetical protein